MFFHEGRRLDPLDVERSTPLWFFTRWVTHFCAPSFVFLVGVSAWLQRERGKRHLRRFLLTRGAWLLVLEATVMTFVWQGWQPTALILQVLAAIGAGMVVLGLVLPAPRALVLALAVVVLVGHGLFDGYQAERLGAWAPAWRLLHAGGSFSFGPIELHVAYPVLPWIAVLLLGFALGPALREARAARLLGAAMLLLFVLLRQLDGFGDPKRWSVHARGWQTVGDFVDVEKYPPSLLFVLMTLGPVLLVLPSFGRLPRAMQHLVLPFGRAPLFAYVTHLAFVHVLVAATAAAAGAPWSAFVNPLSAPSADNRWGVSLLACYAVWFAVVVALFPAVRGFARLKARSRSPWLSYL